MLSSIKSKLILNKIFSCLIKKLIFKITLRNKTLQGKLDLELKDFKEYNLLIEFNKKYKTDITSTDIKNLNIKENKIMNSGLRALNQIEFKYLKELHLIDNYFSIINNLIIDNFNFNNLEVIDFSYNHIADLTILTKADFKNLKVLNLDHNNLKDINVLSEIKFKKLETLILSGNQISDLTALTKMKLPFLKNLFLHRNMIFNF